MTDKKEIEKGDIYYASLDPINSKPNLPTHVIIKKNGKITHDSIILIEQIRVIDKQRLQEYLCKIEPEKIDEINKAMIEAFDITNKYK